MYVVATQRVLLQRQIVQLLARFIIRQPGLPTGQEIETGSEPGFGYAEVGLAALALLQVVAGDKNVATFLQAAIGGVVNVIELGRAR